MQLWLRTDFARSVNHSHSLLHFKMKPDQTHQPDEAKASFLVDEDLGRFSILGEELLHILLCGSSGQVPHKQPAPLRVGLLTWLPEVLQVYSESSICKREGSVSDLSRI